MKIRNFQFIFCFWNVKHPIKWRINNFLLIVLFLLLWILTDPLRLLSTFCFCLLYFTLATPSSRSSSSSTFFLFSSFTSPSSAVSESSLAISSPATCAGVTSVSSIRPSISPNSLWFLWTACECACPCVPGAAEQGLGFLYGWWWRRWFFHPHNLTIIHQWSSVSQTVSAVSDKNNLSFSCTCQWSKRIKRSGF